MASILRTGEHEAVKLHWLHTDQVLELDKQGQALTERNGGFGDWLIEIRYGVIALLRASETYLFKKTKK